MMHVHVINVQKNFSLSCNPRKKTPKTSQGRVDGNTVYIKIYITCFETSGQCCPAETPPHALLSITFTVSVNVQQYLYYLYTLR